MTHPRILTQKAGATFGYGGAKQMPAGDWSAACDVRDAAGKLIETLTVAMLPPVEPSTKHTLTLRATAGQTALWPLQKLRADVAFYDASDPPTVIPTETFVVDVIAMETNVP